MEGKAEAEAEAVLADTTVHIAKYDGQITQTVVIAQFLVHIIQDLPHDITRVVQGM